MGRDRMELFIMQLNSSGKLGTRRLIGLFLFVRFIHRIYIMYAPVLWFKSRLHHAYRQHLQPGVYIIYNNDNDNNNNNNSGA